MGFIVSKGNGTDKVLQKLYNAFVLNLSETRKKHADFDPSGNKTLETLAFDNGIFPDDVTEQGRWVQWLQFVDGKPARKAIKGHLHKRLKDNVPTYCNWIENNTVTTPTVDCTDIVDDNGYEFSILTIITPNYRNLPAAVQNRIRKRVEKKTAKKAGKKAARRRG